MIDLPSCDVDQIGTAQAEELRGLYRAQVRLIAAIQDLSLARKLEDIQEIVRHAAREIAGADGATFVLRENGKCYYADEDAIGPLWKGQRFPLSACVSGWAMLNQQPAIVPDIYDDPRIPVDAYRPTFVKSLVMVPIRPRDPIGAIGTYWAVQRQASPAEIELLQALANTTAVAMENVQVYAELEQRVATRTAQLEAVNHELESFSYSVSHDLRGPLRAISGFTEFLAQELEAPSDQVRGYLGKVQEGAKRMGELIDDLMGLARVARKPLNTAELDISALAKRVAAALREQQPRRPVELVVADGLKARGDSGLVTIVLENLLSNAWKYTGKTAAPRIEVGAQPASGGGWTFFVRDNGAGFEPRYVDRLFKPFERLHTQSEFPGNGVGLATVQRIVHRHGGRIWAEAKLGEGATFHFTLP